MPLKSAVQNSCRYNVDLFFVNRTDCTNLGGQRCIRVHWHRFHLHHGPSNPLSVFTLSWTVCDFVWGYYGVGSLSTTTTQTMHYFLNELFPEDETIGGLSIWHHNRENKKSILNLGQMSHGGTAISQILEDYQRLSHEEVGTSIGQSQEMPTLIAGFQQADRNQK